MNVYMLQNKATGDWFVNYHKRKNRDETKMWTDKQSKGTVWNNRVGPIQAISHNELKGKVDIVEFEMVEIVRDPR